MNTKTTSTPGVVALSLALYTLYEPKIKAARESFFTAMFRQYGSAFCKALRAKLDERIHTSPSPLLGELWPHFLRSLFPVPGKQEELFENLLPNWYALYLLVLLLDDGVDENKPVDAAIITPLLFEALDLFPDKQLLKQSLRGQLQDMKNNVAPEKNAFLRSFASAMNSITTHPDLVLEDAVSGMSMMDFLQILDDIADIEADYGKKKVTTLITYAVTRCEHSGIWAAIWLNSELRDHMIKVFTALSVNAQKIKAAINVRRVEFTTEIQPTEEFALMEQEMFFGHVSHHASQMVGLLQGVTKETGDVEWAEIEGKMKNIFAILAQST